VVVDSGEIEDVLDVESSLGVGVHVLDLTRDGDGTSLFGLLESDHSLDGGVSLEDSDSLRSGLDHDGGRGMIEGESGWVPVIDKITKCDIIAISHLVDREYSDGHLDRVGRKDMRKLRSS
jgi:hypothetical protein